MYEHQTPYGMNRGHGAVADLSPAERTEFMHKTYQHLAGAIIAFIALEGVLLNIPGIENLVFTMLGGRFSWMIVLALFMGVSHVANKWAMSATSFHKQYMGLALYIVAEAIIFVPLLYIAANYAGADVIPKAALITGVIFAGLTATVLLSKKDFSFLGGILRVAGFGALGMIGASLIFGFSLGSWFAGAMAVFAGGAIVYETSNIQHHYRPGQHVAAALGLFASVALLFYYILSLLMSRD
jgi:FtsH-binding integral membrane protein